MVYYYVTLALRENILLVNGSRIRRWWINHHYISAAMSLMVVLWPDGKAYRAFSPTFCYYTLYQGVVLTLQYLYQTRRNYQRRALGKAHSMDVASSETITGFPTELPLLLPFLFAGHVAQLYVGVLLLYMLLSSNEGLQPFEKSWVNYTEEVQTGIVVRIGTSFYLAPCRHTHSCVSPLLTPPPPLHIPNQSQGLGFIFLAVGNFLATVNTVLSKRQWHARKKRE